MLFAALYVNQLAQAPLVGATAAQFGTWCRLRVAQARMELEVIPFPPLPPAAVERACLAIANVTLEEIADAEKAGLCRWEDGGLWVWGIDEDGLARAAAKRERAALAGTASGEARRNAKDVTSVANETNGRSSRSEHDTIRYGTIRRGSCSEPPSVPEPEDYTNVGAKLTEPAEAPQPSKPPDPPLPAILELPLIGGQVFAITERELAEYRVAFPGIDPLEHLRRARLWLVDNPLRRKTARGIRRFLSAWLSREQDRSRSAPRPIQSETRDLRRHIQQETPT